MIKVEETIATASEGWEFTLELGIQGIPKTWSWIVHHEGQVRRVRDNEWHVASIDQDNERQGYVRAEMKIQEPISTACRV